MILLNDENFEITLKEAKIPVLVDFFAAWCAPCSVLGPILENMSKEFEGKIIFAKVNINESPVVSQKFGIDSIPTVLFFKNSAIASGFMGLIPEEQIRGWIEKLLQPANDQPDAVAAAVKEYKAEAEQKGYKLNPDSAVVNRITTGLSANEKKYGAKYCPCRRVTGDKEADKKIICPCYWRDEEIKKDGKCLCGLFVK